MSDRYDFARIEAHARLLLGDRDPARVNDVTIADLIGTSRQSVRRWRNIGVTATQAETLCHAAGFFVYDLFPEVLEDALSELQRVCEAEGCETRYVLKCRAPHQRYCTTVCRKREEMRAKYRRNPEPKRAANRAYKAEVRDALARRAVLRSQRKVAA